jgi:hypothetical protein
MIAGHGPHGASQEPSHDGSWILRRARTADHDAVIALVFDTLRSFGIEPDPNGLDRSGFDARDVFVGLEMICLRGSYSDKKQSRSGCGVLIHTRAFADAVIRLGRS